jgi:hypothetical protein
MKEQRNFAIARAVVLGIEIVLAKLKIQEGAIRYLTE